MEQRIKTGLGFALIFIILATGGVFAWQYQKAARVAETEILREDNSVPQACTEEAKLCPDGSAVGRTGPNCEFSPCPDADFSGWQTYRNEKWGYSMKVPVMDKNFGKIEIIEDGDITFVAAENDYYYKEIQENLKSGKDDYAKTYGITWALLAKKVNNDQEIDEFIKKSFGSECALGEKIKSGNDGMFDVRISAKNHDPENGCFVNYIYAIKYFPEKGIIVAWDLGQGIGFTLPGGSSADQEMVDSFKFTE